MSPSALVIIGIYLAFGILEWMRSSLFHKQNQTRADGWVEGVSTLLVVGAIQPAILFTSRWLAGEVVPDAANMLAGLPFVAGFVLFLLFDDMAQYWWHRASHTFPTLYKLHRPHHNAEYMSIRVVFRNNLFYYVLMPGLWLSGALVYLGLGWVYVYYVVIKMTVIISAHSDLRWDRRLLAMPSLSGLMWVVERTISTPTTHHAHHGKHKADGITNYKGNYGNLLFFWDVLFGTAKITRRVPPEYGVENLDPTSIGEQLAWPLVRSSRPVAIQDAETTPAE